MVNLKKLAVFTAVIIFSFPVLGFGCKNTISAEQKQATKQVTLEYWTVYDDVVVIKSLIDKYREVRPYIKVNVRQFREDEIYQRLVEALAEDRGPDIISVSNRNLGAYLSKLQPMPSVVKDTTIVVQQGPIGKETMINTQSIAMVDNVRKLDEQYIKVVKDDVVRGGKVYGLPLSVDVMALYYNKDLLDRSGIPQPPRTWEEFSEQVKKLTKYDKQTGKIIQAGAALGTGSNIPGSSDLLYILSQQSNVPFVDSAGRIVFNQLPGGANRGQETPIGGIMNFYTDFANPTRDTYTWNDSMPNALDSFSNGSLAFFFGYSYHLPVIKGRSPQLNFGVLPMLQLSTENTVNVANYWVQGVVAKSKQPNEAWSLINYLTHSSATKQYLEKTGRPSALRIHIGEQKSQPELEPFVSQVLSAGNWYRGVNFAAANKAIYDMFKEWLLPAADDKVFQQHQDILNRGAAKINQTL